MLKKVPFQLKSHLFGRGGQNDDFRPLIYTLGGGHGVQGQICDILRPPLAMNRFLPLLATDSHTLDTHIGVGAGGGGALILYRCRAFDLFASVDAHLCFLVHSCQGGILFNNGL
jgi:hypothetical protein